MISCVNEYGEDNECILYLMSILNSFFRLVENFFF